MYGPSDLSDVTRAEFHMYFETGHGGAASELTPPPHPLGMSLCFHILNSLFSVDKYGYRNRLKSKGTYFILSEQ